MKLVSISGIVCFVDDIKVTASFYEKLGFIVVKQTEDLLTVRLNWFWIEFRHTNARDYEAPTGSPGQFIYITVDDIDDAYKTLKAKGITFATEPQTYETGRREAMVRDPDDYKLVFFQKLNNNKKD